MTIKSYSYEAEALVKEYLLAESFVPYISVLGGIAMCKMAYDITHWFSSQYIDGYRSLTKVQRIEWNNRGMSSAHAIYITVMSLFLVFYSDLFSDDAPGGPLFSEVSVGYFITDLAMIFWSYPSLGGMEYVSHHLLSVFAISYAILSGEGQLYTFLCSFPRRPPPAFLDVTGMKRTKTYIVNGVVMFFSWVVARLLLFMFLFYHLYCHYEQVKQMDSFAYVIVFSVPSVLAVMNVVWFGKILRGLRRTLTKSQ
ncbi:unnamed protein product [Spirodela intermedia]|uniref:TLC domain-containing protein n=1 Tax=Spirodela intermedia TaxID=51605 RepID=A0A7I8IJP5_SPIIN|nr:unnamed protein product [Spirodela intermedia]CAA6658058.1 unnamed protein product [Spirodela intermedia]